MEKKLTNYISELNYEDFINNSERIKNSYKGINKIIESISDKYLQNTVKDFIRNPVPSFFNISSEELNRRTSKLKAHGLINDIETFDTVVERSRNIKNPELLIYIAPGAKIGSHNSYPGGLLNHNMVNLSTMKSLIKSHSAFYSREMNEDYMISAMLLHDIMKTWILKWENHKIAADCRIANAAGHHIFIIAELIQRGMDPELIKYTASVHKSPYDQFDHISGYIQAAGILADRDVINLNIVNKEKTAFEDGLKIEHLIMRYSEKANRDFSLLLMEELLGAIEEYSDKHFKNSNNLFHALKNIVLTQISEYELFEILRNSRSDFDNKINEILEKMLP